MGTLQCSDVTMVRVGHGLTLTLHLQETPAYETLAQPLRRETRLQGPFHTPALPLNESDLPSEPRQQVPTLLPVPMSPCCSLSRHSPRVLPVVT